MMLLLVALPAAAHNRSVSYSTWQIEDNELRVELRLPSGELNKLGLDPADSASTELVANHLREEFLPVSAAGPCKAENAQARRSGAVFIAHAQWRCEGVATGLSAHFLLQDIPGHLHLLQLRGADGLQGPYALTAAQNRVQFGAAAESHSFTRYLALGGEHILTGWDHLAFLVIVVLGAATLGQLAWRVTGFTVGHSITLILATLGAVRPPAVLVEAFIALTIACTAAERLLGNTPQAARQRSLLTGALALAGWLCGVLPFALVIAAVLLSYGAETDARLDSLRTALFGLFHGFGFAGVLAELNAGQSVPALPLAGFNLGVEAGQLLFVLPLWWLARRWSVLRHSPYLPAAVLALGCAWFFARIA